MSNTVNIHPSIHPHSSWHQAINLQFTGDGHYTNKFYLINYGSYVFDCGIGIVKSRPSRRRRLVRMQHTDLETGNICVKSQETKERRKGRVSECSRLF